MSQNATVNLDGQTFELPTFVGTENEKAIDIAKLRDLTGYITYDPGFKNTGATKSAITFLDGEEGILRHCGYSIEELADKATFLEVAYLLLNGELPTQSQLDAFEAAVKKYTVTNEALLKIEQVIPSSTHPMSELSALVGLMEGQYNPAETQENILRLIAALPIFAAWNYKKSIGEALVAPDQSLDYCSNFLKMMFAKPGEDYKVDPIVSKALNKLLILHADHEQNCSTSTVRLIGSSHASIFSSVSGGIQALFGPLHGGANQAVIEMLEEIKQAGGDTSKFVAMAKDKTSGFRLMGFGHRVYKNFDPRAKVMKETCDEVLGALGINDPQLALAMELERIALSDEYFIKRNLYPNVDFYSGIILKAIGIPTEMFTVIFALARTVGWISHWLEMHSGPYKIGRPRQLYTGEVQRDIVR
jgi:citrate synthase